MIDIFGGLSYAKKKYEAFSSPGVHSGNMWYNPEGPVASWKATQKGMWGMSSRMPREGFVHNVLRGSAEWTVGDGGSGFLQGRSYTSGSRVAYGGSIFTRGGIREITHDVVESSIPGIYKQGARRATGKMAAKALGKLAGPAFFLFTAYNEGIGKAISDQVVGGAIFGAGRHIIGSLGGAIANPMVLAGAAVLAAGVGGTMALRAGKSYGRKAKKLSFGSEHNDVFGNAATMRQVALQAIQGSRINGRNALGNEGSLLHY